MKILNFTIAYSLNSGSLYSDLNEALVAAGHTVKVVYADSTLNSGEIAEKCVKNGVEILRVRTPKVQKIGLIQKGLSFLMLPFILKRACKKFYGNEKFDLVLFSAPPVTIAGVVAWAKRRFGCPAFLMQKDIFPQNAVDLGMFSKYSPIYFYFRNREKFMLKISDGIGCMSNGNVEYIRRHNPQIEPSRVSLFPNTLKISSAADSVCSGEIRQKYGIPSDACLFLFGGNIGLPQHIELLCSAFRKFNGRRDVWFVCIGSGTKASELRSFIEVNKISNAAFYSYMPREDYSKIASSCDVGIVVLSPRFTIPNYPSKTLSYMASELPILAATDLNTDYRALVETEAECGLWCDSSKPDDFFKVIETFASDSSLRKTLGKNGRAYLEKNFDVSRSVALLEDFFSKK